MNVRGITAAMILTAGAVPAIAVTGVVLPDEIRATFGTGKPFAAVSKSGRAYRFTFNPDGSALEIPNGQKKGTSGTWRVSDAGYCTQWSGGSEHCYTVEKSGSQFTVRDSAGKVVSTWTPDTFTTAPTVRTAPVAVKARFADGTYAGTTENAYYGLVQIQAVVQGGRLVGIKVLRYPSDRSTSVAINRSALPKLRDEVIKAQSANVDIVSGATLTSEAFIQSLSAAIHQARS